MSKFKVGDEVKGIHSGRGLGSDKIGRTTFITEVDGAYGALPAVRTKDFKNVSYNDWIAESSFELVIGNWDK